MSDILTEQEQKRLISFVIEAIQNHSVQTGLILVDSENKYELHYTMAVGRNVKIGAKTMFVPKECFVITRQREPQVAGSYMPLETWRNIIEFKVSFKDHIERFRTEFMRGVVGYYAK